MSYADQRGLLRNAFVDAGISVDAATNLANILANSLQESLQSGRTRTDTTPEGLRFVDGEDRRLLYQNLDFLPGDPDHRATRTTSSEQREGPQPAPNVTAKVAPQQTGATFRVSGGSLAEAAGAGDSVEVNVRSRVARQPPGSLPLTMLDKQSNTLVGKGLRANAGGDGGRTRVNVRQGQQNVDIDLNLENVSTFGVVTGIAYEPGIGLRVNYATLSAWNERAQNVQFLRMVEQKVVTEVVDDLRGFRAHTAVVPSFPPRYRGGDTPGQRNYAAEDIYFNTFRVGTFTGGWAAGTTKTVTQVWPEEGRNVVVYNACESVANTGSTKYVLFAPRTPDKVQKDEDGVRFERRGEDENPVPKFTPPYGNEFNNQVVYYAIEIQHATECAAFSSLNGLLTSDLAGYAITPGPKQALSHDDSGCLEWVGQTSDVVTGLAVSGNNLVANRSKLHVLKVDATAPQSLSLALTPITVVTGLTISGTNITMLKHQVYVLKTGNANPETITIPTFEEDAIYNLALTSEGLEGLRHTLRVLGKTNTTPVKITTTECPPPEA